MSDVLISAAAFSNRLGLVFRDLVLLGTALTHRSYLNEHPDVESDDNERLEYLGDAVLDFLIAARLYGEYPHAREGELTRLRAALVRRETLSRFAAEIELGSYLLMGRGEEETGGRLRPAILCAAFEALVGALYLDQGLDSVAALVLPLVDAEIAVRATPGMDKDPKSRLQELAQGSIGLTPHYETAGAEGPEHAKLFRVEVLIGDIVCGMGEGPSKQAAAQRAATDALNRIDCWIRPSTPHDPDAQE
jgi:ribonuclease-3